MNSYLKEFHHEDITELLNKENISSHASINVDLIKLQKYRPELYKKVIRNVWNCLKEWDKALLEIQKQLMEDDNTFLEPGFQIKENCHVKFINLPQSDQLPKGIFPNNNHVGLFVQIKGNVIRMTKTRLLEFKKEYTCTKCKETFIFEAKYEKMYIFDVPKSCISGICKGILYPKSSQPNPEYCMDYQEIRIQELYSDKNIPSSINVTLENDLTDICQPGDGVTICGTIERRWRPCFDGKRSEVIVTLRAISICKDDEKLVLVKDVLDQIFLVRSQWQEAIDRYGQLGARDILLKSICPDVYGMYLIKLAIALSLCSGIETKLPGGLVTRGHVHLLLIGDPGLAKSKLLKTASTIAIRAIHTTGMGCSTAGLTVAAVKDKSEWELEAGALVLADGGVCCIDEFNLIREHDRSSLHEAMEQQTISIAKAGFVCKLSTRCVVIASTNQKRTYSLSEYEDTSFVNTGIGVALLSRFDLIFVLHDEYDEDWDSKVTDHILDTVTIPEELDPHKTMHGDDIFWDVERLRSHFLAVHDINPQLTPTANEILAAYYQYCRSNGYRNKSRTTVRLLDSLYRLAQSHAKLQFRDYANGVDAVIVVQLMESSWDFGNVLKPMDVIRTELPIGPDENNVREVLTTLKLMHLEDEIFKELRSMNKIYTSPSKKNENVMNLSTGILEENISPKNCSRNDSDSLLSNQKIDQRLVENNEIRKRNSDKDHSILNINDLENIFGYNKNVKKLRISNENKENLNLNDEETPEKNSPIQENRLVSSTQIEKSKNHNEINNLHPNFDEFRDEDFNLLISQSNEFDGSVDEEEFERIRSQRELEKTNSMENSEKSEKSSNFNSEKEAGYNSQGTIFNRSLCVLDFDDKDLEFDLDFNIPKSDLIEKETECPKMTETHERSSTSKAALPTINRNLNKSGQQFNSTNSNNNKSEFGLFPEKRNEFKEPIANISKAIFEDDKISNKIQNNIKPKVSPKAMTKLEMFKNPDYQEPIKRTSNLSSCFENGKHEISKTLKNIENQMHEKNENENTNENDDSAYKTISIINFSNSFVIPLKDDDLSCLDFDI